MHILWYTLLFTVFAWLVVTVQGRRPIVAIVLVGVIAVTLVVPTPAHAQGGVLTGIQAILSLINGVIKTALGAINTVRSAVNNLQQVVVWPQQLINQARAQATQMIGQYRTLMTSIFTVNLNSATLPNPQALETVIRDHRITNLTNVTTAFGNTYGLIPVATSATPGDRAMSDMDDALAIDNLKMLKATDQAADVELQSADAMENAAAQAAPGSAPFLTAAAMTSSINSQALTQKMLAAELRQEAARVAHYNQIRKQGAANTTQLRGILVNLLQHR